MKKTYKCKSIFSSKNSVEKKVTSTIAADHTHQFHILSRPFIWPEPDVIVLCYSSIDTDSFHEAETVIWPDLNERYPDIPIILVATKCDARPDEELWSMDEGKSFITV